MRFSTVNQVNSESLKSSWFARRDYRSWQAHLTSKKALDRTVGGRSLWMTS